jgi:hypothetical protein
MSIFISSILLPIENSSAGLCAGGISQGDGIDSNMLPIPARLIPNIAQAKPDEILEPGQRSFLQRLAICQTHP